MGPGQAVLDVACGTGFTARELAAGSMVKLLATRTAPDGSVTAPFASLLVTGSR